MTINERPTTRLPTAVTRGGTVEKQPRFDGDQITVMVVVALVMGSIVACVLGGIWLTR